MKTVRLILLMFFLILCFACGRFESVKVDPDQRYNEANRLYSMGNIEGSEKLFQWLIRHSPENPRPYNNLGNIYVRQGDLEKAKAHYEKALSLNAGYLVARLNLAVLSLYQGDTEGAFRWLNEGLQEYPENASIHNGLGICALRKGNLQEAITHFRKAIDVEGANPEYYNNLAYAYAESNEYLSEALTLAKKSLKDNSNRSIYLDTLGWVYFKRGVFDEAIETLKTALNEDSESEIIRSHLISVYRWMGDNEQVTALIKDGIRMRVISKP